MAHGRHSADDEALSPSAGEVWAALDALIAKCTRKDSDPWHLAVLRVAAQRAVHRRGEAEGGRGAMSRPIQGQLLDEILPFR